MCAKGVASYNYWTCWVFQAYVLNNIHVKVTHILGQHLYLSILARGEYGYVASSLANLHSEERLTHFLVFKAMLFVCKIKLKVGHSQNKGFITR
jgi:hypothetical protein